MESSLFDAFNSRSLSEVENDLERVYEIKLIDVKGSSLKALLKNTFDIACNSIIQNLIGLSVKIHDFDYLFNAMYNDLLISALNYDTYKDYGNDISLQSCFNNHDILDSEIKADNYNRFRQKMQFVFGSPLKPIFNIKDKIKISNKSESRVQYKIPSIYSDFVLYITSNYKNCPLCTNYKQDFCRSKSFYEGFIGEEKFKSNLAYRSLFENLFGFELLTTICSSIPPKSSLPLKPYSLETIRFLIPYLVKNPCAFGKISVAKQFLNENDNPIRWHLYFAGTLELMKKVFMLWEAIFICKLNSVQNCKNIMKEIYNEIKIDDFDLNKPLIGYRENYYNQLAEDYFAIFNQDTKVINKFGIDSDGIGKAHFMQDELFLKLI